MKKIHTLTVLLGLMIIQTINAFGSDKNAYAWFYLLKHKTGNQASYRHEAAFEYLVLPDNLSKETRSKIVDAKEERIESNDNVKVRSRRLKLEHNERVVIYRLDYENSEGRYSKYFIESIEEGDEHYTRPAKYFVDQYLETSMSADNYKKHAIVYDQKPYVISGKPGNYWDTMKKQILEWIDDDEEKKEIKESTGVGVRG